jgi:hypothetical protein
MPLSRALRTPNKKSLPALGGTGGREDESISFQLCIAPVLNLRPVVVQRLPRRYRIRRATVDTSPRLTRSLFLPR